MSAFERRAHQNGHAVLLENWSPLSSVALLNYPLNFSHTEA
jgi:hypothetical protein